MYTVLVAESNSNLQIWQMIQDKPDDFKYQWAELSTTLDNTLVCKSNCTKRKRLIIFRNTDIKTRKNIIKLFVFYGVFYGCA